jgi:hypothetical protein
MCEVLGQAGGSIAIVGLSPQCSQCRQAPSVTTIVDYSSSIAPPTGHTTSSRHCDSSQKEKSRPPFSNV